MTELPEQNLSDNEDNTLYHAPGWFWPVAIAGLLFEALLAWSYWIDMSNAPATLDAQRMAQATPLWITIAHALSVWIGLVGAILLLLRKGVAASFLFVAMVFSVVRYGGVVALPETRGLIGSDDLLVPFLTLVATYGLWQAAKTGRKRGWLG